MAEKHEDKAHADKVQSRIEELELERKAQANRGVDPTPPVQEGVGRNPSGTYSEPTPTDVRYPNKLETEFENNLGAHIGKSAAQMREQLKLPDEPGGLKPASAPDEVKAVVDKRQLPTPEALEAHKQAQKPAEPKPAENAEPEALAPKAPKAK